MRTLVYVPIIHSEVELGSVGASVRRRFTEVFGEAAWERRGAMVDAMWRGLHDALMALPFPAAGVRLYQDGLPICGHEREIVEDLAAKGSPNHQLLLALMERGAVLMGTEDPSLLLAEYQRIQRIERLSAQRGPAAAARLVEQEGQRLLRARDAFIARRIETSLREGEMAILLLGLLHRVDEHLEGDFTIQHVIHSLPFGADLRTYQGHHHAHQSRNQDQ